MAGILPQLSDTGRFTNTTNELLSGILGGGIQLGFEKIELAAGVAVGLGARPAGTKYAVIMAESDAATVDPTKIIRYRMDGVDPTITDGMPMGNLTLIEVFYEANLANLKFIRIEALTQTLQVFYFG